MAETPELEFRTPERIIGAIVTNRQGREKPFREMIARVLARVPCPDLLLLLDHALFVLTSQNTVEYMSPAAAAGKSVLIFDGSMLGMPAPAQDLAVLKLSAWCVLKARHRYEPPREKRDSSAWYDEEAGRVVGPEFAEELRLWMGDAADLGADYSPPSGQEADVLMSFWRRAWEAHAAGQGGGAPEGGGR